MNEEKQEDLEKESENTSQESLVNASLDEYIEQLQMMQFGAICKTCSI
jgi:hypothetical protein